MPDYRQLRFNIGSTRRRQLSRAATLAAGIFAAGVTLAACGGPSTPGVATGATTTTSTTIPSFSSESGTQESQLLAYSSCMRAHGVPNFPDPGGKGGLSKEAVVSALQAVSAAQANEASNDCAPLMPSGGLSGQVVEPVTAQDQRYYLQAAACLRTHGFPSFPDPVFSGTGVNFSVPSSINKNSTEFLRAVDVCRKLIPSGLPYSGGSG